MLFIGQDVVPVKVTRNVATMPDKGQSKYPSMENIAINTKGVFKLLKDLSPQGPDCIPSCMLKSAADELAPILMLLCQYYTCRFLLFTLNRCPETFGILGCCYIYINSS
jgi:hypothetical protein